MKKIILTLVIVIMFIILFFMLTACNDNNENTDINYPVAGIWYATATWNVDNPYNYYGDTFKVDVYYDFRKDGTLKSKLTLLLNGYPVKDNNSEWFIVNATWSVENNTITLSTGKTFVIVDDEFNENFSKLNIILHFKKLK